MINTVKVSAYTQHIAKSKNNNTAQSGSFIKTNESAVLKFSQNNTDTVEISQEAKDVMNNALLNPGSDQDDKKTSEKKDKIAEWKEKLEEMRREMSWLRDELKRAGEVAEGMGEAMRVMIKCLRIAMRIMSGHNVPDADHRFLMENDSGLYSKAVMMKIQVIDPEDFDRLSEDEEENEEQSGIDGAPVSSTDTSTESTGDSTDADTTVEATT